jgi:hypothetical protein
LTNAVERLWVGGGDGYIRWRSRKRMRRAFEETNKATIKEREKLGWRVDESEYTHVKKEKKRI